MTRSTYQEFITGCLSISKGFRGILLVGGILVFVTWKPLGEPAPAIANLTLAIVLLLVSIFQHPPLFKKETKNWLLFPAMVFALVTVFFWLYVPVFQRVLATAPVPVEYFFLPGAFGLCILLLDEGRKYGVRTWPNSVLGRCAW